MASKTKSAPEKTTNLLNRIQGNSRIKETDILSDSKFFNQKDMIPTSVPAVNIALSGKITGGFTPGLTMWAGPSKHFKTAFSLLMVKAYLDKYPEAVVLFYDSEFGTPQSYFRSFGIDPTRVVHTPITDIEVLKFDIMNQLSAIERGDKIIIVVDSVGNLASKKEIDDALDEKSVGDMSRAKQLKSLFRMVTPHLNLKDIPMVVVNHTYKEIALYPRDIVGGGTGSYFSADNIFILGRQQEKDGDEVVGYNFIINVEKSRYAREKTKIPVQVVHGGGINTWSGLLDIALASGHVVKPNAGWYSRVDADGVVEDQKFRESNTNTKDFWLPILRQKTFNKYIEDTYSLSTVAMTDGTIGEFYDELNTEDNTNEQE